MNADGALIFRQTNVVDQVVHNARLSLANTVKKVADNVEEAFKVKSAFFDFTEIPNYMAFSDNQRRSTLPHVEKTFSTI